MSANILKRVNDLGAAAYLMMHKFKPVAKQGRSIVFEVSQDEGPEFDAMAMEYLSSEFHRFDSCLMSLKKISETS